MPPWRKGRSSACHQFKAPASRLIGVSGRQRRGDGRGLGGGSGASSELRGSAARHPASCRTAIWPARMPSAIWTGSGACRRHVRVEGLDLEELDAHESVILAVGPAGQAVALGPLAGQGCVRSAQVRAILGVVGQEHLRGVAMDGPFLGPLGLAVVGEIRIRVGQGAPGGPSREHQGVGEVGRDQADGGQGAGHAVRHVGVVGRRHDHRAGPPLAEPVHDLGDVSFGRQISRAIVALEVPADPLGPQHVALQAEFALADRDLLLSR